MPADSLPKQEPDPTWSAKDLKRHNSMRERAPCSWPMMLRFMANAIEHARSFDPKVQVFNHTRGFVIISRNADVPWVHVFPRESETFIITATSEFDFIETTVTLKYPEYRLKNSNIRVTVKPPLYRVTDDTVLKGDNNICVLTEMEEIATGERTTLAVSDMNVVQPSMDPAYTRVVVNIP